MTQTPNFNEEQFVDAAGIGGLNAAFGTVSGAIASAGSGVWSSPGLFSPEAMTVNFSGMVASVGLPLPWGVVSASGSLVHAHGTQTGADTQSYSANFSSLVPASGSVTAYLAASLTTIQQSPFSIPGPPPGHPSYNPNFVPSIGYATSVESVALTATSTPPNNTSTFELFRTTLVPSQVTVSAWDTSHQQRATTREVFAATVVPAGGALTVAQAQGVLYPGTAGLTNTLPSVAESAGVVFRFSNVTGSVWTIAASGSDAISGFGVAGQSSIGIPSPGYIELWANAEVGLWTLKSTSPTASMLMASTTLALSSSTSIPAQQAGAYFIAGGSATTQTLPTAASTPGLTFGFYAAAACTVASAGGSFQGGSLSGSTSIALSAGDWIWVQSDGTYYRILTASPDILGYATINGFANQVVFTSSGNWTCPAGITRAKARVWGAGGGGGGSNGTDGGGGGGGGGYAEFLLVGLVPGTVYPITIGTAGTGGASGGSSGTAGSLSTFDSIVTATGGGGGTGGGSSAPFPGGTGGTGIAGTILMDGGHGNGGGSPAVPAGGAAAAGGAGGAGSNGLGGPGGFPGGGGAGYGEIAVGAGQNGANGLVVLDY